MPDDGDLFDLPALRSVEASAAALLADEHELMARAGQAAWQASLTHWPQAQRLLVICGPGNNGGDGYELARHARSAGRAVTVLRLPEHAPRSAPARRACAGYLAAGGNIAEFAGDDLPACDVVVDALFGIGLARAPEGPAAALIAAINRQSAPVLALDVPSGVDAGRGSVPGAAVHAAHTIEFIAAKAGLRTGAALDHSGQCQLATLQVPRDAFAGVEPFATLVRPPQLSGWLPRRRRDTHKGDHGRVLCVGGDEGSGGAVLLCAQAAMRSGAGWVEVATREAHVAPLLARTPEAMAHAVASGDALRPWLARATAVALGPGLGQAGWGRSLFDCVLSHAVQEGIPALLDADALNLLALAPRPPGGAVVLTPHPGEAGRLLGIPASEIQRDRFAAASALCARYDCTVVLKGAGSIVAAPGRMPRVIGAGNPGMAVAGMGDVLSGVIAALLAQGLAPFEAATCGALLHAAAGDAAAARQGERGLNPTDLMPCLRRLANPEVVR